MCGKLQRKVWNNRKLCLEKKMAVYNACISSALWYVLKLSMHADLEEPFKLNGKRMLQI